MISTPTIKYYATPDVNYKEILRLRGELIEKEKQLRTKIGNMKANDFIKMCSQCGLMIDAKEKDNQDKISFAVEQFENCRLNLIKLLNKKLVYLDSSTADEMDDLFDNQIKLLKEGK